tara:strand:- start:98 stop:982 length:885 start_codon:yes stop_codon:yes gene_type:complete
MPKTFWEDYELETEGRTVQTRYGTRSRTEYFKNIGDDFTTEVLGDRGEKWGISADDALELETQFIDEVWGTNNARSTSLDPTGDRAWKDSSSGYDSTWGLDLERVYLDDLEVGDPKFYDYITKGPINYAHYENDPEYKKALDALGHDLGSEVATDNAKARWIREARDYIADPTNKNQKLKEPKDWPGKYDPDQIAVKEGDLYIDGIRQQTLKEIMDSPDGRYNPDDDADDRLKRDTYQLRDINDLRSKEYRNTLDLPPREQFGLHIGDRRKGFGREYGDGPRLKSGETKPGGNK